MTLQRELKSCLWAGLYMAALYTLPLLALAIGWISRDFKTGGLAALITLISLVSLAAGALILVRDPSALTANLPLISGVAYAVLPDVILGTIDDGVAFTLGALLSFLLWRKRRADLPTWLLLPLFAAGAYTTVGGFILPFLGPLDELAAYLIIGGLTWYNLAQPKAELTPADGRATAPAVTAAEPPHPGGARIYPDAGEKALVVSPSVTGEPGSALASREFPQENPQEDRLL